ncbi:MAG: ECF transporter S component [bacterium]|nr:ECF transporter S component [bacterium]
MPPSNTVVRRLALAGLLLALGLVLPVFAHSVGMGRVLLPMHLPVLLGGFLAGPATGSLLGAVTPLASAVLTGMPPLAPPVAQAMALELAAYGSVSGLLYHHTRIRLVPCLVVAMVLGRLVYGFIGYAILPLFGFTQVPLLYPLTYGVVTGLPGIGAQLVLVPTLVYLVQKHTGSFARPVTPRVPGR